MGNWAVRVVDIRLTCPRVTPERGPPDMDVLRWSLIVISSATTLLALLHLIALGYATYLMWRAGLMPPSWRRTVHAHLPLVFSAGAVATYILAWSTFGTVWFAVSVAWASEAVRASVEMWRAARKEKALRAAEEEKRREAGEDSPEYWDGLLTDAARKAVASERFDAELKGKMRGDF